MRIRKYKHHDKERIIELLRLNTPQYFSPKEEKDLIDYLDNHSSNYYVVEADNVIAGCGGFNFSANEESAIIAWDIFHPQSQGKGLGTELTKLRIQKIKEIEAVKTITVRTSQLTYKFYERFGLEIREIIKDFWDEGFDLYRMDCDIVNFK